MIVSSRADFEKVTPMLKLVLFFYIYIYIYNESIVGAKKNSALQRVFASIYRMESFRFEDEGDYEYQIFLVS